MQCTCVTVIENIPVVAHTVGSGLKMKKKFISVDMIAKGDSFCQSASGGKKKV